MSTINMKLTLAILDDAISIALELDGQTVEDGLGKNDPDAARRNRAMLNLADQLLLASALVRNEYWGGKEQLSYDL
jgi:hypothetical protein